MDNKDQPFEVKLASGKMGPKEKDSLASKYEETQRSLHTIDFFLVGIHGLTSLLEAARQLDTWF